jgi:hypothetical protein
VLKCALPALSGSQTVISAGWIYKFTCFLIRNLVVYGAGITMTYNLLKLNKCVTHFAVLPFDVESKIRQSEPHFTYESIIKK